MLTWCVAVALAFAMGTQSYADELAPFKDKLFAYPTVLSQANGGSYIVVDYREARDIDRRDAIPERQVRQDYVSLRVRRAQRELVLSKSGGEIRHFAVGKTVGAKIITVYLHGQGGSRRQGVDDFTFGGNFNRIKNLMVENAGLYLSPDFTDFGDVGASEISALVDHYLSRSPGAKLFIACGSMGGALCWKLAADKTVASRLSGLLLLGSHWEDKFLDSAAFHAKVPIFFGQGSKDKVFPVAKQEAFYRAIRRKSPDYPARFVRFETGSHGTPIRMVDWRQTLNWMMSVN